MTIGERIKARRMELGLSADKLAEMLGKDRSTIYRYESDDIENLPTTVLKPLAEALQTTPVYLMGWEDEDIPNYDNIIPIKKRKIPLLGEIACGVPTYADQHIETYFEVGSDIDADFCLKAKGDSMVNSGINEGDIVFIRKQSTVDDGEIAAIVIDDETTLKRVYKTSTSITLIADNPKYKPMVYTESDFVNVIILGKATAFQRVL